MSFVSMHDDIKEHVNSSQIHANDLRNAYMNEYE